MRLDFSDVVRAARPEVVVHLITGLPDQVDPAGLTEMTNRNARIRVEGTRDLVAAAVRAGARRRRRPVDRLGVCRRPGAASGRGSARHARAKATGS